MQQEAHYMTKGSIMYSLIYGIAAFILFVSTNAIAVDKPQQKNSSGTEKVAVADVIPLTVGNMRGHQMLYSEGWYVVTSSSKAFDYAKRKSISSSAMALRQMMKDAEKDSRDAVDAIKEDVHDSARTGKDIVVSGTKTSGQIIATTHTIAKTELAYGKEQFAKAMESFVQGNIAIAKRTEEDRQELVRLPGQYFSSIKNDFSNIHELAAQARERFSGKIDPAWESAFQKASKEFQSEYERSGEEKNSLMALGPILYGYLKSFYHGLAAPAAKTIVKTGAAGMSYAVFLPVAGTAIVTGRTVQSLGLTVYYTGATAVKIVSPTVEGGLLSGLSLLSLGTVPVTYTVGGTVGAINQVAFSVAGPVAGGAEAAVTTTAHSASYVGFLAYDAAKGTTKVVINQAASGIVLGYNALTAVPTHALLGVADTAVFLAWDGPRLVIATAQGRIKSKDAAESYSVGDLPIGAVVDLKRLETVGGIPIKILSTDPAVIQNVLEKIPDDVREPK